MTVDLSARQQRFCAVALLAASMVVFWFAIVAPVADYLAEASDKRQVELRSLRRDRALLLQEPRTNAALETVEHSARWARLYEARKPENAILEIETDLRKLITTPNNPTSMVAQQFLVQGPLTKIAVKVTLSMPVDQLAETLARLQSHTKFLRIENLLIQGPDWEPAEANPALSIQADVTGFILTPLDRQT